MKLDVDKLREALDHHSPVQILGMLYQAASREKEDPEILAILAQALMALEKRL